MNEDNKELEYRMYVLSLRQLSAINKSCQGIHACFEYANKYHNDQEYRKYIDVDKTLIMVDGGVHQDMVEIQKQLETHEIKHTYFIEPDLNDCMTAITVIADERVWDRENYKSYRDFINGLMYENGLNPRTDIPKPEFYDMWCEYVGGVKNAILYEILSTKKLSQ